MVISSLSMKTQHRKASVHGEQGCGFPRERQTFYVYLYPHLCSLLLYPECYEGLQRKKIINHYDNSSLILSLIIPGIFKLLHSAMHKSCSFEGDFVPVSNTHVNSCHVLFYLPWSFHISVNHTVINSSTFSFAMLWFITFFDYIVLGY